MEKRLAGLTMQQWSKMNEHEKEAIWRLVGLDAAGKNPAVCRPDSVLKEVQPMVGNCSYGDACLVTSPTARWLNVCAEQGCGKPSCARANFVCQSCLKLAIKQYHRNLRQESPTKGERQASAAKRARVDSHGGSSSGVFDMYSRCTRTRLKYGE